MEKEIIFELITHYLAQSFANLNVVNRNYKSNTITCYFSKKCNVNLANLITLTNNDIKFTQITSKYAFDLDQKSYVENSTLYFYSNNEFKGYILNNFKIEIRFKQYSRLIKVFLDKYTKIVII